MIEFNEVYDYRNLSLEMNIEEGNVRHNYYEAGNRIAKIIDNGINVSYTYYVRDLSGKEIAMYDGTNIS